MIVTCFIAKSRGENLCKHSNATFIMEICAVSIPFTLEDFLQMIGLLYCQAATAAALWYTKILFAAVVALSLE